MLSTAPLSCHFINSFIKEDLATLDCHGNASAEPSPLSENTKRARQPLSPLLGRRKRGCFEVEDVPTSPPSHRDGATPPLVSLFTACIVDDEPSPTPLIAKPRAQRCPARPMPPCAPNIRSMRALASDTSTALEHLVGDAGGGGLSSAPY